MATDRTTDDRDTDARRHRELMDTLIRMDGRLERLTYRLHMLEQRQRHYDPGTTGGPGFSARQAQRVEEGW